MKYFVFFNDDYPDNGGVGLREFDSEEGALKFINERLAQHPKASVKSYRLIEGDALAIEPAEVVTRIRVQRAE